MQPRSTPKTAQDDLFKRRLVDFIDLKNPLVKLADRVDWEGIKEKAAPAFSDIGRPGVPVRFMAGMLILKAMHDLADDKVFERWEYDPYYQYFTGEEFFQHELGHDPSSMTHWRGRLGPDFVDALLAESLRIAFEAGALKGGDLERVTVDTTVQPKNVKFPTDANLLYTALVKLNAEARGAGLKLRQSYARVGKRAQIMAQRYAHAKQWKRHRREIRFLKRRLGRVRRDIERRIEDRPGLQARFAPSLKKARIIESQVLNKRAPEKLYSWHAPETECIGKGKAHKPYEFGCKATFTTTNGRTKAGMLVLHAEALSGAPFDGHTLGRVLIETAALTGVTPIRAHVDKGYKGHKQNRLTFDPQTHQSTRPPWRVYMSGHKGLKPHLKKELRRRSAIEPVIGHMKQEHRLGRNFLHDKAGDRFNAKMAAVGFNFTRLLRWLEALLRRIWQTVLRALSMNPRAIQGF